MRLFKWLDAFRKGRAVSNPAAWKAGQVSVGAMAAAIGSVVFLARSYGIELPFLTEDRILVLAGSLCAVIYGLLDVAITVTTTEKIGLPAGDEGDKPRRPGVFPGH